jgi:hypothetical protein
MKYLVVATLLVTLGLSSASAQLATGLHRDFWFTVPLNLAANDIAEKVFTIYVQAKSAGEVAVQIGNQTVQTKDLTEGELWPVTLPNSIEMTGSSTADTGRTIHVWSDQTDLAVYFLSRNPYSSDGFEVISTPFWGNEYVVASYAALIVDASSDLPSEFCIVANADNTDIVVTPTQDIRDKASSSTVLYPKGSPFTVTLQRGEAIQFQTVLNGGSELDLSGTTVTSNKPIGVIGASACPFIPADPYCDHLCEMLLPTNRWGRTYHSLPFAGRRFGGDSFRMIASQDNQAIARNGIMIATLNKFESYFTSDITDASVWSSAAPFMLVQYMNGAMYEVPAGQSRNQGDPAMVQISPDELADTILHIVIPTITPSIDQRPFTNFLNVIMPSGNDTKMKFDGQPLADVADSVFSFSGSPMKGYRLRAVAAGAHILRGPAQATAYAYGYTTDDSYAWPIALSGNGKEISTVRSTKGSKTFLVWPNPVTVGAKLQFTVPEHSPGAVRLIDILGRVVFSQDADSDAIILTNCDPGIYTIEFLTAEDSYVTTLVIVE